SITSIAGMPAYGMQEPRPLAPPRARLTPQDRGSEIMVARTRALVVAGSLAAGATLVASSGQERPSGQGFSFKTGVELIAVSATVTDANGRFVSGLKQDDFVIYEDGKPQTISQFDNERVPVSLGIALDTSGSMLGEKIAAAQAALERFL